VVVTEHEKGVKMGVEVLSGGSKLIYGLVEAVTLSREMGVLGGLIMVFISLWSVQVKL
jgi:hypothetical protein